jgi:hypothetical protein
MRRARSLAGWIVVLGALAVASAPARETAPPRLAAHRLIAHVAQGAGTSGPGVVLGGITRAGWPVIVQMTSSFKTVRHAVIALRTRCTSGQAFVDHDGYLDMRVSRSGRFGASFGPQPNGSPSSGITETAQGSVSGRFNKARTKVSGTWRLTFIDKNAAGATTDTCDSGRVAWHAQQ